MPDFQVPPYMTPHVTAVALRLALVQIAERVCRTPPSSVTTIAKNGSTLVYEAVIAVHERHKLYDYLGQHLSMRFSAKDHGRLVLTADEAVKLIRLAKPKVTPVPT